MKVTGHCHCGKIGFEAEIDPAQVRICHAPTAIARRPRRAPTTTAFAGSQCPLPFKPPLQFRARHPANDFIHSASPGPIDEA